MCYVYVPDHELVCFVLIFAKNEQANLTAGQEKACRALAREIKQALDESSLRSRGRGR